MTTPDLRAMRNVLIEEVHRRMRTDARVFFLSADFGAPALDPLRTEFPARFVNVGIAEQNLINMATGLALEGFIVFAYGIAPFISMRCYEQIRVNLAMLGQTRPINVNLISVGAGISYDMSGPTHHCLEDLTIMRALPHMTVFSPSDWVLVERFADYAIATPGPKYLRLDGKVVPDLYAQDQPLDFARGFAALRTGGRVCLAATGFTTHMALRIAARLAGHGVPVGVIDVFLLQPLDTAALARALRDYEEVLTIEEGFVGRGGLDALVALVLREHEVPATLRPYGFANTYHFENGGRAFLQQQYGVDEDAIVVALIRRFG